MPKYKPGQFIKTPFGRMRVREIKSGYPSCGQCAIRTIFNCHEFEDMHRLSCDRIIGRGGYLTKF